MQNTSLSIFTDGGSRNNPGKAACACVVMSSDGKTLHEESRFLGIATNNIVEYEGVLLAIRWLKTHLNSPAVLNFYLDSLLVVNQLSGVYRIREISLQQLSFEIKQQLEDPKIVYAKFNHVPRSQNSRADFLVNSCLDNQ